MRNAQLPFSQLLEKGPVPENAEGRKPKVQAHRIQNLCGDMLDAMRRLYAHCIHTLVGFIVGFDYDAFGTFHRHHRFIL